MRVERLRPLPSPERLAELYAVPHDHRLYGRGHGERVEATIALAEGNLPEIERLSVADLSCGNGAIALALATNDDVHLGDVAALPAELPGTKYRGPIEETIHLIPDVDVGVFVCSETIEHLDDPGKVLALARSKADNLVLSTPLECWDDDNPEHLWAWDREGVEGLLKRTGWLPWAFVSVDSRTYGEPYLYGIWVAS